MYTIKHAAELTGVSEATLRAWERRYELLSPQRTDAGYRVYTEDDLDTVRSVVALVERGRTPSLAAREVRERAGPAVSPPPDPGEEGEAGAPEGSPGAEATERLVAAGAAIAPEAVGAVLDEQFATGSFETVVDGWLMPALVEVGAAWADGRMDVAGEHLVAHAVHRRLAAGFDAARRGGSGAAVVVGLPSGVHHELGLFAFAVALRRAGLDVVHLGPDVPLGAWRAALDAHGARAAVTAVTTSGDVPAARAVVEGLARSHPDALLVVGGGEQEDVTGAGVVHPGHLIGPGATLVSMLLNT